MTEPDQPSRPGNVNRIGQPPGPATTPVQIPTPPPDRRRQLKAALIALWSFVAVAALTAVAYVAYQAGRSEAPKRITINGALTLNDTDPNSTKFGWDEDPLRCAGEGGYNDISEGASVTIRDGEGKVIAVGNLGKGEPGGFQQLTAMVRIAEKCTFPFRVDNVPERDFYGIEVTHRGNVNYSRDQVRGTVQMNLGD